MTESDYDRVPAFSFSQPQPLGIGWGVGWLLLGTGLFMLIGNRLFPQVV